MDGKRRYGKRYRENTLKLFHGMALLYLIVVNTQLLKLLSHPSDPFSHKTLSLSLSSFTSLHSLSFLPSFYPFPTDLSTETTHCTRSPCMLPCFCVFIAWKKRRKETTICRAIRRVQQKGKGKQVLHYGNVDICQWLRDLGDHIHGAYFSDGRKRTRTRRTRAKRRRGEEGAKICQ